METYYRQQIEKLTNELYPREDLVERIIGAKQFIDRHYTDNLDLDVICKKACVSKYHFIRLFKNIYGCTPHQYLIEVRIKKAKELIRSGMTVRGACFAVGYDSVTSFSTLFKRMTGSAPSRID
jgi:AraC-like DNA-binding protein